jgi:glycosyltransferase involved in cell wall biosynthesis
MDNIKVTVLMPVYNSEKYIWQAIHSVINQTFSAFELLIVNDGSTDKTADIIRSFHDRRIVVVNQPNSGVAKALNKGLMHAKGEYIARFDADDICFPDRLAEQVKFLDQHPQHLVVGTDAEYILENGDHLLNFSCLGHTNDKIRQRLYFYCPFIHSGVMYRKEAVIDAGGYSIHAHSFEDYLLWIRLAKVGQLANIPMPLIKVRYNPASVTIDEKWRGVYFRKLKRSVIRRGYITHEEGDKLLSIIKRQEIKKYKEGSYYALCGKKFLTDNYQPARAREQVTKAIKAYPFRLDNYALLIASFFPEKLIQWLHQRSPNRL